MVIGLGMSFLDSRGVQYFYELPLSKKDRVQWIHTYMSLLHRSAFCLVVEKKLISINFRDVWSFFGRY